MALLIYNTMSRKKEEFKPITDNRVYLFVCGPTVYDYSHLGHARVYTFFDTVVKYLKYLGYTVFYLQNITDIDDKIIRRSKEEGKLWYEIARKYEEEYYYDMKLLHVDSVNLYARATEHIPEIISQVKRLLDKGFAYELDDGIYYDVSKFPEYGKLSHQILKMLKPGARVKVKEEKRTPYDFVLWKKKKEDEPSWKSPWGEGRPGWHIEDTAITERYLGPRYDIHGGGEDLIFPHHESEIAQMEAISGLKPMVRYWMHVAFLTINKEKMAKSLGNIITIRSAVRRWGSETLRLFYASTHYRQQLDFKEEALYHSKNTLDSFYAALHELVYLRKERQVFQKIPSNHPVIKKLNVLKQEFEGFMNDDFNTPRALAVLHKLKTLILDYSKTSEKDQSIIKILHHHYTTFGRILGIFYEERESPAMIADLVNILIDVRNILRERKEYELADKIRAKLNELGFVLIDRKGGTSWFYKQR